MKLGEILTRRGLITEEQLEHGLQAQVQFGGRLGTNLVEMGYISEEQLALALSQQFGTPYVRPEAIASVPKEVIAKVPKSVAEQFRVIPIKVDGREIHLCTADPANLERLDELAFVLNCRIKPYVITEVTLNYALDRYYGIRREIRFLRIPGSEQQALRGPTQSMPTAEIEHAPSVTPGTGSGAKALPLAPSVRQTPTFVAALANVMTEADVLEIVYEYFSETFEEVVILSVSPGRARGVMVGGRHGRRPNAAALDLPLADGTVLHEVATKGQLCHRAQVTDPVLLRMCTIVGLNASLLTAVPIFENRVPTYIVVGQGRDERHLRIYLEQIKILLAKVSSAFQIVTLRNEILAGG